jgi:predicted dehydrogenase
VSLERALERHRPDVVHVCTPLPTHEAVVAAALDARVHALVEKPLAADAETTRRLHERAASLDVLLCPVHQFLFQRGMLRAMAQLPDLGPIRQVDAIACSAGADGGTDQDRERVARDILPHALALARRILGAGIADAAWQVIGGAGEIRATAPCGTATVMLAVSMRARPTENSLTVRCDGGTVRANLYHGYAVVDRGGPSRLDKVARPFVSSSGTFVSAATNLVARVVRAEPAYPGLRELVRRFHRAVLDGSPLPIGIDESVDVAHMRDGILESRRPHEV